MNQIEEFQKMIDEHENIVFFGEQGSPRKAEFRISAVRMVCIIRSMTIRRKRF